MNTKSELALLDEYIDLLHQNQTKMTDADALRAVRTLSHLEGLKQEVITGQKARPW